VRRQDNKSDSSRQEQESTRQRVAFNKTAEQSRQDEASSLQQDSRTESRQDNECSLQQDSRTESRQDNECGLQQDSRINSRQDNEQPSTRKQAPRSGDQNVSHQQDSRTDSQ
jgi:hypothetical protein